MNLSFSKEAPENVYENYRRIAKACSFSGNFVLTRQEHTDIVNVCEYADGFVTHNDAVDGLVTNKENITLTVFVADCVPILIADPVTRSVSAVHSGWRGTAKKISLKAIKLMTEKYNAKPCNLVALIGPCISKCCYEVGQDVFDGFNAPEFFTKKPDGKYMLDLKGANKKVLMDAGIKEQNIHVTEECTFCKSDLYYSHRASKGLRGNFAAMIEI